jgi:oxygen-independent coproporphyrinogen-3 oxidase
LAAQPVRQEDHQETWQIIGSTARTGKSVAYLHIPFCENHCLFCGFYQNPWHTNHSASYADAMIKEIKAEKDSPLQASGPIHAVYFGGGTPTALESTDLCRIIEAVRHYLPLASDCEITIEGRIFSFPLEKAKACFATGANRISIGVQTFETKLRKRLGRKVDGDQAQAFLRDLVALDQGAIVIDLMYGLPEQSLKSWERDVEWVTITKLALTFSPIMGGALFLPPTGAAAPESATSTI